MATTTTTRIDRLRLRVDHLAEQRHIRWAACAVAAVVGIVVLASLAQGRGALIGLAAVAVAAWATGILLLQEADEELPDDVEPTALEGLWDE